MMSSSFSAVVILLLAAQRWLLAGASKPCISTDSARQKLNKDIRISAHIYDVVQFLGDGTRFLDVCSCRKSSRFSTNAASLSSAFGSDQEAIQFWRSRSILSRHQDVTIRGTVQAMNGRSGIVLSHSRQFSGGPPRFRPNFPCSPAASALTRAALRSAIRI